MRSFMNDFGWIAIMCAMFAVMWGTLFAKAWNHEQALRERAEQCTPHNTSEL